MEFTITEIEDLKQAVTEILKQAKHELFTLEGNLGAGKTTMVKEFAKQLGSKDEVTSPTFSLVNEYLIPEGKIFHFDLYRINEKEELLNIGFNEYIDSDNYCFIEWAELVENDLPEHHKISLHLENESRKLIFTY